MGLLDKIEVAPGWEKFISDDEVSTEIAKIEDFLSGKEYYPPEEEVLRFLEVPTDTLTNIIVGMDPYPSWDEIHDRPQATGRCFEVSELFDAGWEHKIKQSSLRNILKAIHYNETGENPPLAQLREKISSGAFEIASPGQWFPRMEKQGVLFLNASLTVSPGLPGSHAQIWEQFENLLAEYILQVSPDARWHLWGNVAQERFSGIVPKESIAACCHPRLAGFVLDNTLKLASEVDWTGMRI